MIDDTRATIGERYGIAATATNLRASAEKSTPLDLIHAAGIVAGGRRTARGAPDLGILLLRLQAEYDAAKAELQHAQDAARAIEAEAKRIERGGDRIDDYGTVHTTAELVETYMRRSEGEILTARFLILSQLRTLRQAKESVGAYALILATRTRFMVNNDLVLRLAGKTLDVHLDPTCHKCDGTGMVGSGYQGEASTVCRACGGTGHRRDQIGSEPRSRWFSFTLLGDLQTEMQTAERVMRSVSSNREIG